MKTIRRRTVATAAAVAALALTVAACSAEDEGEGTGDGTGEGVETDESQQTGAMADYSAGDTFVATEPISISLLYRDHPNYPLDEEWLFFTHLEENHNVSFDITIAPLSDYEQRRSLLIGAGDAPDVISVVYPGQEGPFVASGAILPISDYVDLMPHFQEKVEQWDLQGDIDTLRQEDGKYYMLPGIYEQTRFDYTLGVRTDVLEENDIPEPATWDEFGEMLAAIKEAEGTNYAFSDRWEGNALINVASGAFGTVAGWGFVDGLQFDEEADEFEYAGASEEYRQLVEYFAGLVADGLMDPESFTQDDDQAAQKLANEQSFVQTTNGQELLVARNTMDTSIGGDYEFRKIRVPAGPNGDTLNGQRIENGFMISSDAAEQEDFVATLQFLDWLFYSDEGLEYARWGVEGETFEREADGTRVLAEHIEHLGQNPDADENLQVDYGFFNGVFSLAHGSTHELVLTHISDEEKEWQEEMADKELNPPNPPYPMNEMEREQAGLYQTALTDYTSQNTLAFITGQRPLDEWDAYVSELEGQNMSEYVDIVNGAYQRFLENN